MTKLRRKQTVVCEQLGPEAILYDPDAECIYVLDNVALQVWRLLAQETTVAAVCEKLADIFGVNKTVVEQDTVPFISALIDSGLAERASANDNNG